MSMTNLIVELTPVLNESLAGRVNTMATINSVKEAAQFLNMSAYALLRACAILEWQRAWIRSFQAHRYDELNETVEGLDSIYDRYDRRWKERAEYVRSLYPAECRKFSIVQGDDMELLLLIHNILGRIKY